MPFEYDVFLSYCSADRDWARKLSLALKNLDPPRTVFYDEHSLRAGDVWEARIEKALENSRHLIVLWSGNAKGSDWVSRELWTFFTNAKPRVNNDRRLIFLNLQGMNEATKTFQQIGPSALQKAYEKQQTVDDATWAEVMADVNDGLDPTRRAISVPLVVLTTTRKELHGLAADRWAAIEQDFNITRDELLSRYDDTKRDEWRPFGGSEPLKVILDHLRAHVNNALTNHRIHWSTPEESFWADIVSAKKFVQKEFETGEMSVLVIDPVALYRHETYQRLMLFQDCFVSNRRVILTLPPFGTPASLVSLRKALVSTAMPYFDDYFQPPIPPKRALAAFCGWNAGDEEDIRRLLLYAVGQFVQDSTGAGSGGVTTFLRHGARQQGTGS